MNQLKMEEWVGWVMIRVRMLLMENHKKRKKKISDHLLFSSSVMCKVFMLFYVYLYLMSREEKNMCHNYLIGNNESYSSGKHTKKEY